MKLILLFFLMLPAAVRAQIAATLPERLAAASAESALDSEGLKPWHLKMTATLYTAGKPAEQLLIEEWWLRAGYRRVVYSGLSYSATTLETDGKPYQTRSTPVPPMLLQLLVDQVTHPGPSEGDLSDAKPALKRTTFGPITLDCIMLNQPIAGTSQALPLGLFPAYCLDQGKDSLRASYEFGSQIVLRNTFGRFQGKSIATQTDVKLEGVMAASAHVTGLETKAMTVADFEPGPDLEALPDTIYRPGANVAPGHITRKVTPVYPETARATHLTGAVQLHAIIGRDGRIRRLTVLSTPSGDCAVSAIDAVRLWTYEPFRINGLPVEVDTTITVNFNKN